jgi:hypothetical protein
MLAEYIKVWYKINNQYGLNFAMLTCHAIRVDVVYNPYVRAHANRVIGTRIFAKRSMISELEFF